MYKTPHIKCNLDYNSRAFDVFFRIARDMMFLWYRHYDANMSGMVFQTTSKCDRLAVCWWQRKKLELPVLRKFNVSHTCWYQKIIKWRFPIVAHIWLEICFREQLLRTFHLAWPLHMTRQQNSRALYKKWSDVETEKGNEIKSKQDFHQILLAMKNKTHQYLANTSP